MEKTQTFLERMCDVSPDGFLCVDVGGVIRISNQHAAEIFGYPLEEMRGLSVEALVPFSIRDEHRKWRLEYMAQPTPRSMAANRKLFGVRKDKSVIPLTVDLSPFPTKEGMLIICNVRDMREEMRRQDAVAQAEARFRQLCDAGIIGICIFDMEMGLEFLNEYAARLLGYDLAEFASIDPWLLPYIPEEHKGIFRKKFDEIRDEGKIAPWRMELLNRQGAKVPVLVGMSREHKHPNRVLGFVLDMSEAHTYEDALRNSEKRQASQAEYLQKILDSLPVNIAVLDAEGKIVSVNRAWREFANENGFAPGEHYGIGDKYLSAFCPVRESLKGEESIEILLASDGLKALQMGQIDQFSQDYACHSLNEKRWFTMLGSRLGPEADDGMVVAHVNITDKKLVEEELQRNALFDGLTGLPNRAFFMSRLDHAIQRASRNEEFRYAVLFMDLDRFKNVNDALGHQAGDLLLKEVARRLRSAVRDVDTVGRLGGDEFVVLLEDLLDSRVADIIADRIQRAITCAYDLNGTVVHVGASIGIAQSSPQHNSASILLRNADAAMYAAKEQGRGRVARFDERLHQQALRRLQIEADLSRAIERGELSLQFQPIINVKSGEMKSFEALMRWNHPERGMVSPMDFIPVAEDTGLIIGMGHWLINECCRQRSEWLEHDARFAGITMNVNLSPKQFLDPKLPQVILDACRRYKCEARDINLEITESVVMENFAAATNVLGQLRAVNASILLDDFGTGYSSLGYIHKFPVDGLKIDRSFVMKMHEDESTRKIIKAIIGLARDLDLSVTAEGVEREEHLEALRALGCEQAQGYFFSRPVDAAAAEALAIKHFSRLS